MDSSYKKSLPREPTTRAQRHNPFRWSFGHWCHLWGLMPLTFPAHQVAVLPLKLWRPRWFDGTALVIGAGSPDLFSGLTKIVGFDSHHWDGVMWAVPFTIIYATLLRRFAADGLFGSLPDMWLLKTRSYRVLRHGRPRLLVTVLSAFIGVMSHITLDSFTHPYRWGSNLLRLNDIALQTPLGGVTQARGAAVHRPLVRFVDRCCAVRHRGLTTPPGRVVRRRCRRGSPSGARTPRCITSNSPDLGRLHHHRNHLGIRTRRRRDLHHRNVLRPRTARRRRK